MDVRSWQLSAVSMRLLLDLHEAGRVATEPKAIARLAVEELLVRGALRACPPGRSRLNPDGLYVRPDRPGAALPPPLATLADALAPLEGDLAWLVRGARHRNPRLFKRGLREEALHDLAARGLVEPVRRRALGLVPRTGHAPTAEGRAWAQAARDALDRASDAKAPNRTGGADALVSVLLPPGTALETVGGSLDEALDAAFDARAANGGGAGSTVGLGGGTGGEFGGGASS